MACSHTAPDDRLYALARDIFAIKCSKENSLEANTLAIQELLAVVHRAVADSAACLNEKTPSLFLSLPVELRLSCLSWLSLPELVTASHVSRGWRKLIVETPTFWNSIPPQTRSSVYLSFVKRCEIQTLRSGSLPLDFQGIIIESPSNLTELNEAACLSSRLRVLLDSVMHRIRSLNLTIHRNLSAHLEASAHPMLWRISAPMLESINVFDCEHHTQIPDSWWQSYVPKLRVLRLGLFEFPATPDLSNRLQVFQCAMRDGSKTSDIRQLFLHFPHLVDMTFTEVDRISLLPHTTQLPASLRHIAVQSALSRERDDLAPLLSLWRASPALRSMTVDYFPQFTLNDAVQFYAVSGEPWELAATSFLEPHLAFRGAVGPRLTVSLRDVPWLPDVDPSPHWLTLRALALSGVWVRAFVRSGLELPALVSLTVQDDGRLAGLGSEYSTLGRVRPGSNYIRTYSPREAVPTGLRVPALQLLAFTGIGARSGVLPDFIARWLRYDAPRLRRISVSLARGGSGLADADVLALRALALKLYY